jgi:hypothetical protein
MDKEYVPYEQSLELEQLGFDEYCMEACYYEWKNKGVTHILLHTPDSYDSRDGVKAPLYQQSFRWFREKHNIDISINTIYSKYNENTSKKYGGVIDNGSVFTNVGFYDTYEESELACLKKLIEIVKNK